MINYQQNIIRKQQYFNKQLNEELLKFFDKQLIWILSNDVQNLLLINKEISIVYLLNEITYIINILINKSEYKNFHKEINKAYKNQEQFQKDLTLSEIYIQSLHQNKTIELIFQIIEKRISILQEEQGTYQQSSYIVLKLSYFLMSYGSLNCVNNQNAIYMSLDKYLSNYFEGFNIQDVQYNELQDLIDLIKIKQYLQSQINKAEQKQLQFFKAEKLKIKFLFLYLQAENFNKKLSCCIILDQYQNNQISKEAEMLIRDELLQKDIIKYLYGKNSSLELIKRNQKFVEFISIGFQFQHILQILDFFENADIQKKEYLNQILQIAMNKIGSGLLRECLQYIEQQNNNTKNQEKLISFLVQSLTQNQKSTMSGFLQGFGLDLSDKQISALKEQMTQILFKKIITQKVENISIYLNGFKELLKSNSSQQFLELYFNSSITSLKNQNASIYTLDLLKYILEQAKPKKNVLISFGGFSGANFDENVLKKQNMGKIIFNILFNYIDKLVQDDFNQMQILFQIFTLLIQKFSNVQIERQYLSQIWIYCFEFENQKLSEIFSKFIFKNYDNYWKKYQIFPYFFQDQVIIQKPNKYFYDLFFNLMIMQNNELQLLRIETKNVQDQIFVINDKIEILEGLNEIWTFYLKEEDEQCLELLQKQILSIYYSFNITDQFANIKKYFLNFLNRQKIYLKNYKDKNQQQNIQKLLDIFSKYLNVLKEIQFQQNSMSSTQNSLIKVKIDNDNNQYDIWVDLEDNLLQLLQRVKSQLKIQQELLVTLNTTEIINFNFLRKYKIKHIEMNKENKRVVQLTQSTLSQPAKNLFDFTIQILKSDHQIYQICDYLLNSDNFIFQETLTDFLYIFSPQTNYQNHFIIEFTKIPSGTFSEVMQIKNKSKFLFLCNLMLIIIKYEKSSKDQILTDVLKKKQISNIIQFLNEIFIIEEYQFVQQDCFFILVDIIREVIDKDIDLTQFQLNIQNFNKNIIKQDSFAVQLQKGKNKEKFIQLQIKFYQCSLVSFYALVQITNSILQNDTQDFDALQLACSITQAKQQDENFLLQILKAYKENYQSQNLFQKIFYLKIFIQGFHKEFLLGDQIITLIEDIFQENIMQFQKENELKFFVQLILEISSQEFIFQDLDCDFTNVLKYLQSQYFESKNYKNLQLFHQPDFIGNYFSIFSFLLNYKNSSDITKTMLQDIFEQIKVSQYLKNWNRQVISDTKRNNQYTGLINLGCTCYINSTIQQLFMTKQFRKFLKLLKIENDQMELLLNLELLLNNWQQTQQEWIDPKKFIDSIRMFGNEKINYSQQMDVDEFIICFFDQIEKNLQNKKYLVDVLKNFFYGQFKQEIKTQQCQHASIKYEQFVTLSLYIKNQHTLQESLNHLIEWDSLGGENSYQCNTCNQKDSAHKRLTLSIIPNFLFCVLKRFEYDFVQNKKLKIGDIVKFPFDLDLSQYYTEQDKSNLQQQGYFDFTLKGIIIHSGDADRGHYVSIIKNEHNQWYLFNDKKVYQVDQDYIEKIAFGQKFEDNLSNSAYVLLYQRQKLFNQQKQIVQNLFDINEKQYFHDEQAVNMQLQLIKILNKNYCQNFFQQILLQNGTQENFQISCVYFFKITIRNNDIENIFQFYKSIYEQISKDITSAQYFLQQFLNQDALQEFLIFCPNQEVKGFVTNLLIQSVNILMKQDESLQLLCKFINTLLSTITLIEKIHKNNLLFILLIIESITQNKKYARILYNFKLDYMMFSLFLNKKLKKQTIIQEKSSFIQAFDEQIKIQKFEYEVDQVIIRILLSLSLKLNLQSSKIFQKKNFLDCMISCIANNHTNKKIAEFFMICTKQDNQLIKQILYNISIDSFNFKKIFFILLEISYLNDEKIFEQITNILYKSVSQNRYIDIFYFDYMIKFFSEVCIQNQQFLDFVNSDTQYREFVQELININELTKNIEALYQSNFKVGHPLFYPENQYDYVVDNSPSFKDFLSKKYVLRKRYLNAIKDNSLENLIGNTVYLYFKDVRQIGITNQEYVIQNSLLYLERFQVLETTQTLIKLRSKSLGELWILKEDKQILENF